MRRSYTANRLTRIPAAAKTTQPVSELGQAVAALTAGIADHTVEACPVCNRYGCDCGEWPEMMFTDPTTIELTHQEEP